MDMKQGHTVKMDGRKMIEMTGVIQVERFDSTEFVLETIMGKLKIRGTGLKMKYFDTVNKSAAIEGRITAFMYVEGGMGKSFFRRST
ncbi:YabP/YqfC family sporulation protein [Domibacillus sp. 8LH]|uniref:YabP/YqfC family sporulation protein n=1 Tax=unclassified Domibacillus TaxID=2632383 RepID=UPI001F5AC131|nr:MULTISPECIES: YabP/YqfC family sporulation protein [unclassified Domibacillus]MCI2256862.1 sporulation protein YabP [Domibacillus sp. PGB-M46]